MSVVTVEIVNGEVKVTADGTKLSCSVAHDVEKAVGQVTKSVATGHKVETTRLVQK